MLSRNILSVVALSGDMLIFGFACAGTLDATILAFSSTVKAASMKLSLVKSVPTVL
jgi:hypothetical protein